MREAGAVFYNILYCAEAGMEINVAQLLKSSIGTEREYEISGNIDILGDGTFCSVDGKVNLVRTDRGILARGLLVTGVGLTCGRCLSPFRCPLTINIEEEYFPTIDIITGARLTQPDEPEHFTIDERHILDLTEAVRQAAVLAMPMKPLCSPECAGLCPGCGQNLNLGPCQCPPSQGDERWAVLQTLPLSDKEKGN